MIYLMHSSVEVSVLPQSSKIRIPFVESNAHPVVECSFSPLLDDECLGNIPQFTPWLVTYYMPSNRYHWCSLLSAPYYDFLSSVESGFPELRYIFLGLPQMIWLIDISHPYTGLRYSFFLSLLPLYR